MSRFLRSSSEPPGPATRTISGSMVTVTVAGTGMGLRPMRDMPLPDLRHDLAADTGLTGLVARHHAAGRRDDRGAHAALDLADAAGGGVVALARARDAAQAGDRRAAVVGVLQAHADELGGLPLGGRHDLEALDVALLAQDPRHLALELGGRDVRRLVSGVDRVADTREEVGDGVGHGHGATCSRALPAGLGHPGDEPIVGQLPQADPADAELAIHGTRAPAAAAPTVLAGLVLGGAGGGAPPGGGLPMVPAPPPPGGGGGPRPPGRAPPPRGGGGRGGPLRRDPRPADG